MVKLWLDKSMCNQILLMENLLVDRFVLRKPLKYWLKKHLAPRCCSTSVLNLDSNGANLQSSKSYGTYLAERVTVEQHQQNIVHAQYRATCWEWHLGSITDQDKRPRRIVSCESKRSEDLWVPFRTQSGLRKHTQLQQSDGMYHCWHCWAQQVNLPAWYFDPQPHRLHDLSRWRHNPIWFAFTIETCKKCAITKAQKIRRNLVHPTSGSLKYWSYENHQF